MLNRILRRITGATPTAVRDIRPWHLNPTRRIRRAHIGVMVAAAVLAVTTCAVPAAHADTLYMKGCLGPVHKHITTHAVDGGIIYETADPIHPVDSRRGHFAFMLSYTYCPNEAKQGIKKLRSVRGCVTWETSAPYSAFYRGQYWRFTVRNDPEHAAHKWRLALAWDMKSKRKVHQCTNWHAARPGDVQWVGTDALMQYAASTRAYHYPAIFDNSHSVRGGWWILHPSTDHKIW